MADTSLIAPLGRQITLHDRTWYGHILPGHPDLASHRSLVHAALTDPLSIRIEPGDAKNRLYIGAGLKEDRIIVVVSSLPLRLVKTAFQAPSRRAKGVIEWKRP